MTYIAEKKFGKTEKVRKNERDYSGEQSHEYLINLFCKQILKSSKKELKGFNDDINQLKKLRVDSDYLDIPILSDKGLEAKEKATRIHALLKSIF